MTNEEIVEGLKLLEDNMVHFDEVQNDKGKWIDVHELLFETIEALSQEPCDAVSRETLIAKLAELIKTSRSTIEIKAKLIPMIQSMPSVTQKSGKWIKIPKYGKWKCSKCGTKFRFTFKEHDYCPNCGARMEGSDKE